MSTTMKKETSFVTPRRHMTCFLEMNKENEQHTIEEAEKFLADLDNKLTKVSMACNEVVKKNFSEIEDRLSLYVDEDIRVGVSYIEAPIPEDMLNSRTGHKSLDNKAFRVTTSLQSILDKNDINGKVVCRVVTNEDELEDACEDCSFETYEEDLPCVLIGIDIDQSQIPTWVKKVEEEDKRKKEKVERKASRARLKSDREYDRKYGWVRYDESGWIRLMNEGRRRVIKGKREIQFEDDLVVVYNERGIEVYKGMLDYCPYKNDDMEYDPRTRSYKVTSPDYPGKFVTLVVVA